jgi:stage V sporulation protein R
MSRRVQELLLAFGVLSSRKAQRDGCRRVYVFGRSAEAFREEIGFGLPRKRRALDEYLDGHRWFKQERDEDQIVSIERGRETVYDVTVEETHRYAAGGLVNHNSFWHSKIMTEKALSDAEVVDFADRHAGTLATAPGQINPYKLGIELFRDIEERWNQGKFGKEWEEEDDYEKKVIWDTGAGLGREKIFEVRKIYNDVTFLDTFLTEEFCEAQKLYVYGVNPRTGQREIVSRDWRLVKDQLLNAFTNRGQPVIEVLDGNYRNRGELYLIHRYDGKDLKLDFAQETLKNLFVIWKRPVHVETIVEGQGRLLSFDGERVSAEDITPTES